MWGASQTYLLKEPLKKNNNPHIFWRKDCPLWKRPISLLAESLERCEGRCFYAHSWRLD